MAITKEAVELLVKAAELIQKARQATYFVQQLETSPRQVQNQRNFTKLLDQQRESLYLA